MRLCGLAVYIGRIAAGLFGEGERRMLFGGVLPFCMAIGLLLWGLFIAYCDGD
jgi:hypothetical protein